METTTFSIEYPVLKEVADSCIFANVCSSNANYFTEGASRGTCCCDCDK